MMMRSECLDFNAKEKITFARFHEIFSNRKNDDDDEDERAVPIMKITEKTESPVIATKARLLDQAFPVLVDLLNSELVIRAELSKLFEEMVLRFAVVRGVTKYTIDHKRPAAMITRLAAKDHC